MKKYFLGFLLFISQFSVAQIIVKGNVSSNKIPLEGAAIYLNNSSIGTTSDSDGNFELTVREGSYDLIISYLGYKTISYPLVTSAYNGPLVFNLNEDDNRLDEIVIRKTVYDNVWRYNLDEFKRTFIGSSSLAKDCEILNPKVLHFEFDSKNVILEAFAKEPLRIKHKSLGYLITYDLVSYKLNQNMVTYLGYTKYETLKGGRSKKRKWNNNRLKAYRGSRVHFFKSLIEKKLKSEGYIVNQFKRKRNPERPSDQEIKSARALIRQTRVIDLNTKKPAPPKSAIDSALSILRKSRLPEFIDYLYKRNVPYEEIFREKEGKTYLTFENYLSIIYTREKEDINYLQNFSREKRAPGPQTSSIVILNKYPYLELSGLVINPLDIFYEGYWGFEKIAETLPLDYNPNLD
ncbi:MAG: carboxypeptidase-like regulatory domain-containing protein [Flavobacteriaceae bacterium]